MTTATYTSMSNESRESAQPLNASAEAAKTLRTGAATAIFPGCPGTSILSTPFSQQTVVSRIIRWFFPLLVSLVLSSCSNLPMLNLSTTEEAKVFAHGLDQYLKSRDLTTLKLLPKDYPPGEWRTRAEGLIDIAEQNKLFAQGVDQYIKSRKLTTLKLLTKQYPQGEWRTRAEGLIDIAEQQQQQQDRLEKQQQELAHTLQEKEVLFEDNKILEVTLERLKQVLIDMELRKE
ncbi:MAG: hypothetical protein RQ722_03000 [Desulfuromonadales bacterium]|nr:hypothetical protein [Desulfuromonadales bacterium]